MGEEKSGQSIWATIAIGLFAALMGNAMDNSNAREREEPYLYPTKPSTTMSIDVDDDGLADIVGNDGKVQVQQSDGSYIPLREHLGDSKFFYREVSERNSVDNLDYSINTGRHIVVSQ